MALFYDYVPLTTLDISLHYLTITSMILFLVFFPRYAFTSSSPDTLPPDVPKKSSALIVGLASLTALLLVGLTSTVFLIRLPAYLLIWANALGICAAVLSCIQYIPQLWTTWKIKHVLSLSITTMIIQVPGSFLFAFSLWLRVGWQGWSTWFVYCVTGSLQAALLAMAVTFWRRERSGDDVGVEEPGERDPLLESRANGHTT